MEKKQMNFEAAFNDIQERVLKLESVLNLSQQNPVTSLAQEGSCKLSVFAGCFDSPQNAPKELDVSKQCKECKGFGEYSLVGKCIYCDGTGTAKKKINTNVVDKVKDNSKIEKSHKIISDACFGILKDTVNSMPSLAQEYTLGYDLKPHFICEFCKSLRYEDHPNSFCCQSYHNKNCGKFENDVIDESRDKWNSKFDFLKETHTKDDINFIKMIHVGSQAMSNLMKNPTLDESQVYAGQQGLMSGSLAHPKKPKTYWVNIHFCRTGEIKFGNVMETEESALTLGKITCDYYKTISFTIDEVEG